jgi:lipopolysaccharide/colanic/teichoic acid biosynthesis glycosyltransferase
VAFGWRINCKEMIDRAGSLALIGVLSPVLVLCAVLVRCSSAGPILYRRRVVGIGGRQFDAFKFRTMVADADRVLLEDADLRDEFGTNMKLRDDPRLTPVGRFLRRVSLDELPQLFNVLRGEMSLVGPRMISPDEVHKYGDHIKRRMHVKPGITGLWQVSGRQDLDYDERVRLDLHYIDNWSLKLDFEILAKTIPAVLSMRGAY